MDYTVKIIPNDQRTNKVADAELHFTDGPLAGLRLIGFAVWETRITDMVPVSEAVRKNRFKVTFPSRTYRLNGESRSFALLRPIEPGGTNDTAVKVRIIEAYQAFEAQRRSGVGL